MRPRALPRLAWLLPLALAAGSASALEPAAGAVDAALTETAPPPFTERYTPPADRLAVERIFTAGRKEAQRFDSTESAVYARFAYRDANPGQTVTALWEHLGAKDKPGIGLFARRELMLEQAAGQAQFNFRPEPAGSWLPGDYRVILLSGRREIARTPFSIAAAPAPVPAKAAAKTPAKPAAAKPAPAAKPTGPQVLEAVLAKTIEQARPKDPTSEYTHVWRRLLLWVRIDGGSQGAPITARWYSSEGLQTEHTETVGPGENWVVFWLYHKAHEKTLPLGPARVELLHGTQPLRTVDYTIKQAGFLDGLTDTFQQLGNELQWLLDQKIEE